MPEYKKLPPSVIFIFGGSGDLNFRKLNPALFNLFIDDAMPEQFGIVGIARSEYKGDEYEKHLKEGIDKFSRRKGKADQWKKFASHISHISMDVKDANEYKKIDKIVKEKEAEFGTHPNIVFYMAVAPQLVPDIVKNLGTLEFCHDSKCTRIVVEKPFGHDLESAKAMNQMLSEYFDEEQIFRIDHYLGKETVQNILVFRFGNSIFEPIWNRNYIDSVQITVAEKLGVEQRGGYYDTAGALRDMIPNHIFQLITLTAMEPPVSFKANAVRDEQAKILQAIQPFTPEDVLHNAVRGQYGAGKMDDKKVVAYREEQNVSPESNTETFAALKILIDNWRWANVPFYIRTGKRLPEKQSNIVIQFKKAPFMLFRDTPVERLPTNRIVIHIQPDEGITLHFGAKIPGPIVDMGAVDMDFNYIDHFGKQISTGYERLLYDCMTGDATLFQRADMVEASWCVVSPVLDVWQAIPARDFPNYESGTWGPAEADELLANDGRKWKND
ncbi:MAG: glucose-6-phosphate dehydrogenase [Acidobacteriota bacterium]|nr:glucose-6-phosphate dehydrogenase [Acidobacteriota bacterium]